MADLSPTVSEVVSETASAVVSAASSAATSSAKAGLDLANGNKNFGIIGIILAVVSGLFIGTSFVIKKKGLLASQEKYGNVAGEGHGYLKSVMWWIGMIMMIVGEILNFVAYAFTVAVIVAPMGSVSVIVAAILSHFFLGESLTFFGWLGCILCILGSIILALNAPHETTVATIPEFLKYFVSPGFLVWMSLMFAISIVIVFYVAPRWGKTNMMPYISVCSLVGGISVSCTQGLGSAIVTSIQGNSQIKHWFFWFLLIFVIVTLLIEINYLNKALELFNTSMVVPVYFCFFTTATMVTSFILYRGLKAPATSLITMVLGFFVICLGITILQMSKVDPNKLQGLDRRTTLLLAASRHKTEGEEKGDITSYEEPGMDALRGGFGAVGSIIRARSVQRRMSTASSSALDSRASIRANANYAHNLNTHGMAHLPRYQLSDNPVPEHMEHIALSPTDGYGSSSYRTADYGPTDDSKRSNSALTFDDTNVVHKYGYTTSDGQTEATHTHVQHDGLREDHTYAERTLAPTSREKTFHDYEDRERDSKTNLSQLLGVFTSNPNRPASPRSPSGSSFSLNFARRPSADRDQVRGGAARGTRDYPHLSKHDAAVEREERAKLVESPDHSDGEDAPEMGDLSSPPQTGSGLRSPPVGILSPTSSGWRSGNDSPRRPMGPR